MRALYEEIPYFQVEQALVGLAAQPGLLCLDSSDNGRMVETSRYSYLCYQPLHTVWLKDGVLNEKQLTGSPLQQLQEQLNQYQQRPHPDLPPFQGGVAGCFSYDLCHYVENIPRHDSDPMGFPDLAVGFYDVVVSLDHQLKKAWVVSTGYPERQQEKRLERAKERLQQVKSDVLQALATPIHRPQCQFKPLTQWVTQAVYESQVQRVVDYILDGDAFEVCLSQPFYGELEQVDQSLDLYLRLRKASPAPFSGYFRLGDFVIASASPERFLSVRNRQVQSRPIKGTIAVSADAEQNEINKATLMLSEKDRAENIMIVDLMRNDLSRVCQPGTVQVDKLCGLESYTFVHHLVSVVTGRLREDKTTIDLLEASFPGGSITGAPKIRAMQIIAELEPTPRGPHFGSLGYIGFSGDMDTSILIRSFAMLKNKISCRAGGAVVLDSNPQAEYEETLVKMTSCQKALQGEP